MKEFLKKSYPFLSVAASADGPIGQAGATYLSTVLGRGVKQDAIRMELSKLALANDDTREQASSAELAFATTIRQLGYETPEDLEKVAASEQEKVVLATPVKDNMPIILGIFVNALFFLSLLTLVLREIPTSSRDIILILMGALVSGWKDCFSYYFGSSAGSAAKTAILDKVVRS